MTAGFDRLTGPSVSSSDGLPSASSHAGFDFTSVWTIEDGIGRPMLRTFLDRGFS